MYLFVVVVVVKPVVLLDSSLFNDIYLSRLFLILHDRKKRSRKDKYSVFFLSINHNLLVYLLWFILSYIFRKRTNDGCSLYTIIITRLTNDK